MVLQQMHKECARECVYSVNVFAMFVGTLACGRCAYSPFSSTDCRTREQLITTAYLSVWWWGRKEPIGTQP